MNRDTAAQFEKLSGNHLECWFEPGVRAGNLAPFENHINGLQQSTVEM
jgi:hypothetical protein